MFDPSCCLVAFSILCLFLMVPWVGLQFSWSYSLSYCSMARCLTHIAGLVERLRDGESVIIAEGYMWEFERRGYLKLGSQTPEVVLEHPEMVTSMSKEFVHAGSDVVEAFTVSLIR